MNSICHLPVEGKLNTPELSVIPVPIFSQFVANLLKLDDIGLASPVKSVVRYHTSTSSKPPVISEVNAIVPVELGIVIVPPILLSFINTPSTVTPLPVVDSLIVSTCTVLIQFPLV